MHQQQSRKYRHSFMLLRKEYPMLDPIQFLYLGNGRDMLLRACPMENGTKGRRGSAWHSGGSRVLCLPKGIMLWRRVSGGPIYQLPVPSTRPGGGRGRGGGFFVPRQSRNVLQSVLLSLWEQEGEAPGGLAHKHPPPPMINPSQA